MGRVSLPFDGGRSYAATAKGCRTLRSTKRQSREPATVGPYLVLVLLACGLTEIVVRRQGRPISSGPAPAVIPAVVLHMAAVCGLGALAWVALKVGALSYGGGFVIIPLMQHDAVTTYHWVTGAQFLNAVALGQITPGPVVQTVRLVGDRRGLRSWRVISGLVPSLEALSLGVTLNDSIGLSLNDIPLVTIDGESTSLAQFADKVKLIVNVASRCGLTPQYEKLEELQKTYGDRGFTVLGFQSNQFLQELGSSEAIKEFCSTTYGVTFPMFERVRVNGRSQHPLYAELTKTPDAEGKAGKVRWNFEKLVVTTDGAVYRFRPKVEPDAPEIVDLIEASLPAGS